MAERERVIEVRNLKTAFGRTVIHEDLDLDVYRGEILGIVGASGGGKSVLLNTSAPSSDTAAFFSPYPLSPTILDHDKLLSKIARAIDDKRVGNLVVRAHITDVRRGQLSASGQGVSCWYGEWRQRQSNSRQNNCRSNLALSGVMSKGFVSL